MKPHKKLTAAVACVLLAGCSMFSPQQKSAVRRQLDDELAAGNITQAQHDAAAEALDKDQSFDWTTIGIAGANIMLALLGVPLVMRTNLPIVGRGQPTQKYGITADLVKPAPPPS